MAGKKIGVGIIGMQPGRSWGAVAHVPALKALDEYDIVALSTTRMESASAAAAELGVPKAYDNYSDLVNDPAVDLVAVTVKVPAHRELVAAALAAGKHVYCEWPLGNGLAEAEAMAADARNRAIACAVGMQARSAPAIDYIRKLIADGYVGEVLSTTLVGSGLVWGPVIDIPNAYTMDKANGATMLTIPMGHTLDALCHCLGEITELSATMAVLQPQFLNAETGETGTKTSPDQVAFTGRLANGAVAAVHYRSGMTRGSGLLWDIHGTEGDLQVTSFGGHAQMLDLAVMGGRGEEQGLSPLAIPAEHRWVPESLAGPALNVAQAYRRFANDMRDGTRTCPDFDDAVQRHRMIAAIELSAAHGKKETV
ncbi:Gfo/Idh/MocA family protein [Novosphingobium lentum]|uniref:Gfo/Idh/MocA family protein n=1 Tax=Novosphingobium lentum TaxID=145287 RepID=UPI0009FF227B|nr:Gfo/Idh/MocA family oxidoreductase [Novosphingobium lentum]